MFLNHIPSENDIVNLCLEKYNALPKTGKPNTSEWTVLSCIILHNQETNVSKVVALGTGTKSIGKDQLCPKGFILNDSHAEIIARRAFLRYIYDQLSKFKNDDDSLFQYNSARKRFKLKNNISFHFFSTYPPCGDASIIENLKFKSVNDDNTDECSAQKRFKVNSFENLANDTEIFTGAKLIGSNKTDLMDQEIGAVRTKPGRGAPTLSMSCSDKIARWNMLGIQGALLDSILEEPIYLNTYTFCSRNVNLESICRAFYKRWSLSQKPFINDRFHINQPKIFNCLLDSTPQEFIPSDKKEPCPSSIVWCDVNEKSLEIAVSGKRQGIIKKNWNKLSSSLYISKVNLFKQYKNIVLCRTDILKSSIPLLTKNEIESKSYENLKNLSVDYQLAWKQLKMEYIKIWIEKPLNLKDFT